MKSVAIFYYSLTGNSEAAARAVASGLPPDCTAHLIRVLPSDPRWQLTTPFVPMWRTFLGTLAPTTRGEHVAITTEPAEWPASDAVIVGSSTWWNRPCLPIQSLLRAERFRAYVANKPVGIFAACRGFFRNNLHELACQLRALQARVVARDRFAYTGGFIGTFLTFFAMLKFGAPQQRWLGAKLPPYGFQPDTLARAKDFGARFARAAASDEVPAHPRLLAAVRTVFLLLTIFDLALATAFTFLSERAIPTVAPPAYADPVFFQRCVGLFLFQYVFIQFLGFRDPMKWATALTMTVAVRASFAVMYLAQLALWGAPWTALHWLFLASSLLDAATTAFVLVAMAKLDIGLFQGDTATPPGAPASSFLRLMLLVLAIAELGIGLGWIFAAAPLCRLFDIHFAVDPFWTRATGVFLVNIALIQYLGHRDPNKYRSAALTSGVFRALWPVLYWVTTAQGEGNALFRLSIMFFSFFDLISCITIFALLRRMARAPSVGAPRARAAAPAAAM